jgi:hypothetical protein
VSIIEGFRDAVVASTRNARAEAGDRDHALSDACMMYDRYFDELISTVGMNHEPSPVIDTSAHGESFWTRLEGLKSLAMEVWQAERRQDLLD